MKVRLKVKDSTAMVVGGASGKGRATAGMALTMASYPQPDCYTTEKETHVLF